MNMKRDSMLEQKITGLIDRYMDNLDEGKDIDQIGTFDRPDREKIIGVMNALQGIVFPGYYRNKTYKYYTVRNNMSIQLEDIIYNLSKQIEIVLGYNQNEREGCIERQAQEIVFKFLDKIPEVREYIETDVQATLDGDPAAFNKEEVIYTYPGLYATMVYRLAHELYLLGVPLIPRMMTEYAHSITGIDINPGATIGKYFFIDHGTGIVVGETTTVGDNVKVYQGVTLGALSTKGGRKLMNTKRHPTIMDNVTIYSGASILGGNTIIGEGAVIGGNAFITKSVPAGARVTVPNQEMIVNVKGHSTETRDLEQDDTWYYMI